jgi:hypothetical protein
MVTPANRKKSNFRKQTMTAHQASIWQKHGEVPIRLTLVILVHDLRLRTRADHVEDGPPAAAVSPQPECGLDRDDVPELEVEVPSGGDHGKPRSRDDAWHDNNERLDLVPEIRAGLHGREHERQRSMRRQKRTYDVAACVRFVGVPGVFERIPGQYSAVCRYGRLFRRRTVFPRPASKRRGGELCGRRG